LIQALKKKLRIDTLNSEHLKAALFDCFRFNRNMHCVTETPVFYRDTEDFVAFTKDEVYCIEIKVDKQDFLNDFKTKQKHMLEMKFDKFYFCVPESLEEFALDYLKAYSGYGLIVVSENAVSIKKNAKRNFELGENKFFTKSKRCYLFLRMGSELANEKVKKITGRNGK